MPRDAPRRPAFSTQWLASSAPSCAASSQPAEPHATIATITTTAIPKARFPLLRLWLGVHLHRRVAYSRERLDASAGAGVVGRNSVRRAVGEITLDEEALIPLEAS